jgi:hypothetical protein
MSSDRYTVLPLGDRYVIRDGRLRAFCTLDGESVLTWETRNGAQRWLNKCYGIWGHDPDITEDPPPASRWGTRRHVYNPARSPWEGWLVPPFGDGV